MNNGNDYESQLWTVLGKERLADFSRFHQSHFHEEVPLYSRESDISFLSDYSSDKASLILLRFALKFLQAVVSYEKHSTPYCAAVTVWNFSDDAPVVPNIFVWSGPIGKLCDQLTLEAVKTPFGKKIKRFISQLHLPEQWDVLEDTATVPDIARVFLAPAIPPSPNVVPLYLFRKVRK